MSLNYAPNSFCVWLVLTSLAPQRGIKQQTAAAKLLVQWWGSLLEYWQRGKYSVNKPCRASVWELSLSLGIWSHATVLNGCRPYYYSNNDHIHRWMQHFMLPIYLAVQPSWPQDSLLTYDTEQGLIKVLQVRMQGDQAIQAYSLLL